MQQLTHHIDWLNEGLDGISLSSSENVIWMTVTLHPNLNIYGMNRDLDMLRVIFLLSKTLRCLLCPTRTSITDQLEMIMGYSEEEVLAGCIHLRGTNNVSRKLLFCITYDLLFFYEHYVVRLYMLFSEDIDDVHYYAA